MKKLKNNKPLAILVGVVALFLLIGIISILIICFGGNNNGKYGNRLEGIEKVQIKDESIEDIKKNLKEQDGVEDVNYNLQGKIVKFTIKLKGVKIEDAQKLVNLIKLSKKQLEYYDIQVLFLSDDNKYPMFAYKNNENKEFFYTYDKVGETSE